jgi:hypothetical protein
VTAEDVEDAIDYGDGVQWGECWAGVITCPVVGAPRTFFYWHVTSWNNGEVMQQFASRRQLLEAMPVIAPISEWTIVEEGR